MKKSVSIYIILIIITLITLCIGILVGSTDLNIVEIMDITMHKLFSVPTSATNTKVTIFWNIRLPRVLLSFIVGGSLAVSGTIAQSVLQNPLASPYTLGVSSGASLGAALVILCSIHISFLGSYTQIVFGFIIALLTIIIVLMLSFKIDNTMSTTTVILTGMVVSLFFSGLLTAITAFNAQDAGKMEIWKMGSFQMRGFEYVRLLFPIVAIGVILSMLYARELDMFSFGSKDAQSMGVNVVKSKTILFIIMSALTGASVSICGTIGFVDLIAPFIGRKFVGNSHKFLLPTGFVVGGCMMVLTDTFARTVVSPSEMPVGAVTALLGAPFFFYVYQSNNKKRSR